MRIIVCAVVGMVAAVGVVETSIARNATEKDDVTAGWTSDFSSEKGELTHTGKNPYFVLEPGYQLVFEGVTERVVKTVLDETKVVDGIECRVVEEREWKDGKLIEVSRNYFAPVVPGLAEHLRFFSFGSF